MSITHSEIEFCVRFQETWEIVKNVRSYTFLMKNFYAQEYIMGRNAFNLYLEFQKADKSVNFQFAFCILETCIN